jgi:hypothetical protein
MDEDPAPRPGPAANVAGCSAAIMFGVMAAFPFLFAMFWGGSHCSPVPECQRAGEGEFWRNVAPFAPVAALFGFSVRALVHWGARRSLLGREAGRPPLWAVAVPPLLIAGMVVYFRST